MGSHVKFEDFSVKVKAALNETTIAWLHETANEVTSQAQRNCVMEDDAGKQLKGSYKNVVDDGKGEAQVGSPLESAYWEEWGTGEYAAHKDGRKGWWVFVKGAPRGKGGKSYNTREEAEEAAKFLRKTKKLDAYATNGRRPNYTLENAFKAVGDKAVSALQEKLKGRMGE